MKKFSDIWTNTEEYNIRLTLVDGKKVTYKPGCSVKVWIDENRKPVRAEPCTNDELMEFRRELNTDTLSASAWAAIAAYQKEFFKRRKKDGYPTQ